MQTPIHEGPPPDHPDFIVCPGRYFLANYFMDIPKSPKSPTGGNMSALLWRFQDEPTHWWLTICFRYYRDEVAFGSADHKEWKVMELLAVEEAVLLPRIDRVLQSASGHLGLYIVSAPPEIFKMVVRGDWLKFKETAEREKPFWLHTQSPARDEKERRKSPMPH